MLTFAYDAPAQQVARMGTACDAPAARLQPIGSRVTRRPLYGTRMKVLLRDSTGEVFGLGDDEHRSGKEKPHYERNLHIERKWISFGPPLSRLVS